MSIQAYRIENLSRRNFLKQGAGLTLGVVLPTMSGKALAAGAGPGIAGAGPVAEDIFSPNAFVRIGTDDTVTVIAKHLEMGQGTYTGLATLVAEELDANWNQVKVQGAPSNARLYNNLFWGQAQGTGGSTAIANSFMQMRQAGAAARSMLVAAAAAEWGVPASEIRVSEGIVRHPASHRQTNFGALAEAAARQPVPQKPALKDPKDFRLIGHRVPRKDSKAKSTGKAIFTQDIKLPGMLVAVVAHPPRFGATVKAVDEAKARKIPGVVDVVRIPSGVAVLARDTWTAKKGRDALAVTWDERNAWRGSSEGVIESYSKLAATPGTPARHDGDAEAALGRASKVLEAEFVFPYLAHAAMEPMNCVIRLGKNGCEVWNGEQFQTGDQHALANLLGLKPDQVKLNMLYAGGSFGRRAAPNSDYLLEAAHIVKAIRGRAPVKLVWMREDDMRGGNYRPLYVHRIRGALNGDGMPLAWSQRIVGQSIITGTAFESGMVKNGIDATSVEGAANLPYAIPNLQVELHTTNAEVKVPVQWWRSVGSSHTAFSTEVFLDELAYAAGADPVEYRLKLPGRAPPSHGGAAPGGRQGRLVCPPGNQGRHAPGPGCGGP